MAELKTKVHDQDVVEFINDYVQSEQKKEDSFQLIQLMETLTGCPPKMWGDSMIGFGSYHYKSKRSTQEGDWFLVGFSPRKSAISLYVYQGEASQEDLLQKLGKFTMGKACIYVKKLSDIHLDVLSQLIVTSVDYLKNSFDVAGE